VSSISQPVVTSRARVRSRTVAIVVGLAGGVALAVAWSSDLVDSHIGMTVANSVLGHDARQTAIAGSLAGVIFAFVSGLAGTFTACNIAVFGALPTVAAGSPGRRDRISGALRALGWLSVGLLGVAIVYGFFAVLAASWLPQLSTNTVGHGVPVRLLQSSVVFGVVGLAFLYLGLASLRVVPDVFATRPRTRLIVLGGLIAGFLVGRPYPLFFKLLTYAADTNNPWYGALALALQAVGNILVMGLIAIVLSGLSRSVARWLSRPDHAALVGGAALLLLGTFLVIYWDVRLPARFGYGWFPMMPWNS
jgi:cytochrome c biogenesis protein CcdA